MFVVSMESYLTVFMILFGALVVSIFIPTEKSKPIKRQCPICKTYIPQNAAKCPNCLEKLNGMTGLLFSFGRIEPDVDPAPRPSAFASFLTKARFWMIIALILMLVAAETGLVKTP